MLGSLKEQCHLLAFYFSALSSTKIEQVEGFCVGAEKGY